VKRRFTQVDAYRTNLHIDDPPLNRCLHPPPKRRFTAADHLIRNQYRLLMLPFARIAGLPEKPYFRSSSRNV
jgi:hypothetical protein